MERKEGRIAFASLMRSEWTERVIDLVLVPLLLLYSLWLPPASVGARFFHTDYPLVTPDEGGYVATADGAMLSVPAGAVEKRSRIRLAPVVGSDEAGAGLPDSSRFAATLVQGAAEEIRQDSPDYLALQRFPANLMAYAPFYQVDVQGQVPAGGSLSLPIPYEMAVPALADLYGWDGTQWTWLPSQTGADGLAVQWG